MKHIDLEPRASVRMLLAMDIIAASGEPTPGGNQLDDPGKDLTPELPPEDDTADDTLD